MKESITLKLLSNVFREKYSFSAYMILGFTNSIINGNKENLTNQNFAVYNSNRGRHAENRPNRKE